jgi:hypothetical protein
MATANYHLTLTLKMFLNRGVAMASQPIASLLARLFEVH